MRVLDLFCGAGGAAMGLHRAMPAAEIVGVDIKPQPNYPFEFVRTDAMMYPLTGFDFIWASPPCQAYSWSAARWHKQWPDLVAPIRDRLRANERPYVIENVVGAPLIEPLFLEGPMFGLKVIRRRLFESSFPMLAPVTPKRIGTVSGGQFVTVAGHGGDGSARLDRWKEAMGIDWMTKSELAQAIPPAYSEYIGRQWLAQQ